MCKAEGMFFDYVFHLPPTLSTLHFTFCLWESLRPLAGVMRASFISVLPSFRIRFVPELETSLFHPRSNLTFHAVSVFSVTRYMSFAIMT